MSDYTKPHEWAPMPLTKDDDPDHKCGGRCACVHCSKNWNDPIHTNYPPKRGKR